MGAVYPSLKAGQTANGYMQPGVLSYQATLPAAATAGNLIVIGVGGDKNIGTLTLGGGGWTESVAVRSASVSTSLAWKTAAGGEQTVSVALSSGNPSGTQLWIAEYEQDGTGAWELKASATKNSDESNSLSWSSGTTGAATGNGLGIAAFSVDSVNTAGTPSYTNGYTTRRNEVNGGGQAGLWVAEKQIDSGTTTETTLTRTGAAADQMSGGVIVLGRALVVAPATDTTLFFLTF
jgi:hypothetical protein